MWKEQMSISVDSDSAEVTIKCPNTPEVPLELTRSISADLLDQHQLGVAKRALTTTFTIILPSEGVSFWSSLSTTTTAHMVYVALKLRAHVACGKLKFLTTTSKWSTAAANDDHDQDSASESKCEPALGGLRCSELSSFLFSQRFVTGDTRWVIDNWTPISMTSSVTASLAGSRNWDCSSCGLYNHESFARLDT